MPVQQLKVSNPSKGVVVVTPDPEKAKSFLRFEAAGDKDGGDVQFVPRDTALLAPLVKAVQRGVLVIDDDISGDPELVRVLGKVEKRSKRKAEPLTAVSVDTEFDKASASYKTVERRVPVVIDPLVRV